MSYPTLENSRRSFLYGLGATLGSVALTDLLAAEQSPSAANGPLAAKPAMNQARAKNVIMLFMEGGPGQMDTFDPKPELSRQHKQESKLRYGLAKGFKFFVGSPFEFRKVGNAGIEMCDQWVHLADPYVADELCNIRGCQAESLNHPEALFHMNTGSRLGGDPALGAWATYGPGYGKSKPAGLRRDDRIGRAAGWCDELEQRISAGTLSRYASSSPRLSIAGPADTS